MLQDIQTQFSPKTHRSLGDWRFLLGPVLIAALILSVYWQVLAKLVSDWWQIPDYSHGFLVPIFAAYLVWTKKSAFHNPRIAPNSAGIPIIAFAMLVLLLGVYGAELFLSRVSMLILLGGLVLCFGGWQLLKELRFALL